MKLRLPEFERPVRELVKREVNASAALKKERRGTKRARPLQWVGSLIIWSAIAVGVGFAASQKGDDRVRDLIVIIGSYMLMLNLAGQWRAIEIETQGPLWRILPLSGMEILTANFRLFARGLVAVPVVCAAFYFTMAAASERLSASGAAAMAAIQTVTTICSGLHFAAYVAGTRGAAALGGAGWIIMILAFFNEGRKLLLQAEPVLGTLLPWGWAERAGMGSEWRDWMFAAPLALWFAAAPGSLRRIRSKFLESGPWTLEPIDDESEKDEGEQTAGSAVEGPRGVTEIEEAIRGGELKASELRAMDWIETLVFRKWNAGQRGAADFLWPFARNWAGAWRAAAKLLPVLAVFAWVIQNYVWDRGGAMVWLLVGLVLTLGAAPLGSTAPGLRGMQTSGVQTPIYGMFPIAYDDLYGSLVTANRIRVALWAPLYILYAAAIGWLLTGRGLESATMGAKIALIHLAIQPLLAAAWISSNTTTKGYLWMFAYLIMLGTMVGAVIAIFWKEDGFDASVWKALAALLIAAKATQLMHRFLYRRGKIDLTNRPKG